MSTSDLRGGRSEDLPAPHEDQVGENADPIRPITFATRREEMMTTTKAASTPPNVAGPRPGATRLILALACAAAIAWVSGVCAAKLAMMAAPTWAADPARLAPLVIAVVYVSIIITLLAVMGRTSGQRRSLLSIRRPDRRSIAIGVGAWAAAYVAAVAAYAVLDPITGIGVEDLRRLLMSVGADNGRLHEASAALVVIILLRMLVLSPIAEELIFRGALYTWLRTRLPAWATILITALGFALVHQSPLFLPLALLVGLAAGWIREKTGTVVVPMAVHALQSGAIVVLSLVLTSWDTPALLH